MINSCLSLIQYTEYTIFSVSNQASSDSVGSAPGYDWRSEENFLKWKGIFVPALQKVLTQVHPTLVAREDALDYVEGLILRLLAMLTAKPTPLSVQDVEDRITRTFPTPIDRWKYFYSEKNIFFCIL